MDTVGTSTDLNTFEYESLPLQNVYSFSTVISSPFFAQMEQSTKCYSILLDGYLIEIVFGQHMILTTLILTCLHRLRINCSTRICPVLFCHNSHLSPLTAAMLSNRILTSLHIHLYI